MLWAVGLLFMYHFFINVVSWVDAVLWMRRWYLLSLDISSLLYLHVSDVFHGVLLFGASGQLKYSQGALIPQAPQTMGLYVFSPRTLVHMSSPDWCTNGPFPILKLGSWALCCVWILPFHKSILFVYYLVVQLAQKTLKQCNWTTKTYFESYLSSWVPYIYMRPKKL